MWYFKHQISAPLAQWIRAPRFGRGGRGFKSYRARKGSRPASRGEAHPKFILGGESSRGRGSLAQLAEQIPLKDKVTGSTPVRPINLTYLLLL